MLTFTPQGSLLFQKPSGWNKTDIQKTAQMRSLQLGFYFICVWGFFFWFIFAPCLLITLILHSPLRLYEIQSEFLQSALAMSSGRLGWHPRSTITSSAALSKLTQFLNGIDPSPGSIPGKQTLEFTKAHSYVYYHYSFRLFKWNEGCLGSNRTRPNLAPAGCPWACSLRASHVASASWRDPNAFAGGWGLIEMMHIKSLHKVDA